MSESRLLLTFGMLRPDNAMLLFSVTKALGAFQLCSAFLAVALVGNASGRDLG
jgi:hypothetical protein